MVVVVVGCVGVGITGWPGVSRTSISVRLICVRSQTTDGHARGSTGDYSRPWKNKRNPSKCPSVSSESLPLPLTASRVFLQGGAFTQKHVTRERTFDFNLVNLYFNEFIYIYFENNETLMWCSSSI